MCYDSSTKCAEIYDVLSQNHALRSASCRDRPDAGFRITKEVATSKKVF